MKTIRRRSSEMLRARNDDVYYMLTLDPSIKDHRLIALLIDYTSRSNECPFYIPNEPERQCSIAPDFTVIQNGCQGRCFIGGLTCPVVLDHAREAQESGRTSMADADRE